MPRKFRAAIAESTDGNRYQVKLRELEDSALPAGDVVVEVQYSSLNYKDALAITGQGKIIRRLPMVCGIDLAGTVLESQSPEFSAGDQVIAIGQGLSETYWGGYSQLQRLPAKLLTRLPEGFDTKQAMAVGTAGFTAMLCVLALEHMDVRPGGREVVVTGAAGGVGSFAVALLARLGYNVAASTGRQETHAYLRKLGATSIVRRAELAQRTPPLASERWAGGVDTVGGQILATILSQTAFFGAIAACGMAAGSEFTASVFPLILRNVSLLGITSTNTPAPRRDKAWRRLASDLPKPTLESLYRVEPMSRILELSSEILAGRIRGRVVIDVNS